MLEEITFAKNSKYKPYKFAYSGKLPEYNKKRLKRAVKNLRSYFDKYKHPFILTIESNSRYWFFQIEDDGGLNRCYLKLFRKE